MFKGLGAFEKEVEAGNEVEEGEKEVGSNWDMTEIRLECFLIGEQKARKMKRWIK